MFWVFEESLIHVRGAFNKFPYFFVWAFKIIVDFWKFAMLLLYILWDDWPIFYVISSKWTATAVIGIHPTKARLSQLVNFKNTVWHFRRTICNKILTAFRPSCINRASVFEWHKRLKGGRESVRDDERCGRNKEVNTHQSWLAKRLGLRLVCWGFKGVQEEIPKEEASTLQIGSVAFPPGQCTSPQLHPCHRLFDQDRHQDNSSAIL